jgi:DNA-binding NtrC family response regulator
VDPILVVDDRLDSREFVRDILAERGHSAILAADGEEALRIISQRPVRLVVTDVHMPGIGGMELLDRLRVESPGTLVIMFTGDCRLPLGIRALSHGAFYFLEKPIRSEELLALVDKALTPAEPGEVAGVEMTMRRGLP